MTDIKTFLFCGGGSGGHLFPAVAVIQQLRKRFPDRCRFLFLTTGRSIEREVLKGADFKLFELGETTSLDLKRAPLRSSGKLFNSFRRARKVIKQQHPDVVIGLGGFGSVAGVLAARTCSVPIILLEQNIVAGRANACLARFANVICTSFPETVVAPGRQRIIRETGNPIREEIVAAKTPSRDKKNRQLLILGGSQGATALNRVIIELVQTAPQLFDGWQIVHQTGNSDNAACEEVYSVHKIPAHVVSFIDKMEEVLPASSLVVTRAGATTLAELASLGLPAIVVPYPKSIRDHQLLNAQYYEKHGGATVVQQSENMETFCKSMKHEFSKMLASEERRQQMGSAMSCLGQPDAATNVFNEILKFCPSPE